MADSSIAWTKRKVTGEDLSSVLQIIKRIGPAEINEGRKDAGP